MNRSEPDAFHKMFDHIQDFTRRFRNLHRAIDCQKLIGLDVLSPEGHQKFVGEDIKKTRCVNFVRDAVRILEEIM